MRHKYHNDKKTDTYAVEKSFFIILFVVPRSYCTKMQHFNHFLMLFQRVLAANFSQTPIPPGSTVDIKSLNWGMGSGNLLFYTISLCLIARVSNEYCQTTLFIGMLYTILRF